jgi:hypothetical protein
MLDWVAGDGLAIQAQQLGDCGKRVPGGEQSQHLDLALGERIRPILVREYALQRQFRRHVVADVALAASDRLHRMKPALPARWPW